MEMTAAAPCCTAKAQTIWNGMSKDETALVRFGMFPHDKMAQAEKEGCSGKYLAVALMEIAKKNGGMRA